MQNPFGLQTNLNQLPQDNCNLCQFNVRKSKFTQKRLDFIDDDKDNIQTIATKKKGKMTRQKSVQVTQGNSLVNSTYFQKVIITSMGMTAGK